MTRAKTTAEALTIGQLTKRWSVSPERIRKLIEQVSPGTYLGLYGLEEFPHSEWNVYGNQVERRLF